MTIQVDWAGTSSTPGGVAYEIYVPKADMTLLQASPTEIRELDLETFRYALRDLEDDPDGRPWPKTHQHNTEVSLGGITFARIVEVLDPYSITFEDGQYAVQINGGNSNVGDKANVNQVSVRPNNSAGLITSQEIRLGAFGGGVWVDQSNGTDGTVYPTGTFRRPVKSIPDARLIASYYGLPKLFIVGNAVFGSGDDASDMIVVGESAIRSEIEVLAAANVEGAEFESCYLHGEMDGECSITCCKVGDLSYVEGCVKECMLLGTITLTGSNPSQFVKCVDGLPGAGVPTIDCGGSGRDLGVWGYHGGLKITNKTGPESVSINMDSGRIIIDATVTAGTILVKGAGLCEDNSTGTATVNTDGLNNPRAVWDALELDPEGDGTMGRALQLARFAAANGLEVRSGDPGTLVLRDDAGDVALNFTATDEDGNAVTLPAGYPAIRSKGVAP